jgi:hypothetical protein
MTLQQSGEYVSGPPSPAESSAQVELADVVRLVVEASSVALAVLFILGRIIFVYLYDSAFGIRPEDAGISTSDYVVFAGYWTGLILVGLAFSGAVGFLFSRWADGKRWWFLGVVVVALALIGLYYVMDGAAFPPAFTVILWIMGLATGVVAGVKFTDGRRRSRLALTAVLVGCLLLFAFQWFEIARHASPFELGASSLVPRTAIVTVNFSGDSVQEPIRSMQKGGSVCAVVLGPIDGSIVAYLPEQERVVRLSSSDVVLVYQDVNTRGCT